MSHAPRLAKTDADKLPNDLIELQAVLEALPAEMHDRVRPVFDRVVESTKRRRRILNLVQDALSQLRLDLKYLMFDLEATRRERDEYRRQIEETNND